MNKHSYYFFSYVPSIRYHISRLLAQRGWVEAANAASSGLGDRHLSINDEISKNFEYKHLLAKLLEKCEPPLMPLTYAINDENCQQVFAQMIYEHYLINRQYQTTIPHLKWILKPSMLNNGDEIHLFNNVEEIKKHYASAKRVGGEHVLQRYISNPALIDGRKYTYRLHMVLTNYAGVFLYDQGYINISALPFSAQDDFQNRKMHITNYVLDGVLSHIEQRSTNTLANFASVYEQMRQIVTAVISALIKQNPGYLQPTAERHFEIFGLDFMADETGKLWLLEINQGPDAPTFEENHLHATLWQRFWQDMIDEFAIPCALNIPPKSDYAHFTRILTVKQSYSAYRNFFYRLFHS